MLLSPSKTQDFSADWQKRLIDAGLPVFKSRSLELMKILKAYSPEKLEQLMNISAKLAELNYRRFQDFSPSFTADNAKPAILAFRGDVYDGLNAETLSDDGLLFAQRSLRILSGLYGLLRPFDLIQPYRLEMSTPLPNPSGKDLYAFWEKQLATQLNRQLAEANTDTIINLASNEYADAVTRQKIKGRFITIHFKENRNGKLQVIGLFAKRARGLFARHIITNRLTAPKELTSFMEIGYRFDASLSDNDNLIFTRTAVQKGV